MCKLWFVENKLINWYLIKALIPLITPYDWISYAIILPITLSFHCWWHYLFADARFDWWPWEKSHYFPAVPSTLSSRKSSKDRIYCDVGVTIKCLQSSSVNFIKTLWKIFLAILKTFSSMLKFIQGLKNHLKKWE